MGFLSDLASGINSVVGGVLGVATNAVTTVLGAANPVLQTVGNSPVLSGVLGSALGLPATVGGGGKNNTQSTGSSGGSDSSPWYKQTWFIVVSFFVGILLFGGLIYAIFKPKRKRY